MRPLLEQGSLLEQIVDVGQTHSFARTFARYAGIVHGARLLTARRHL
jgi:hypothetical protein